MNGFQPAGNASISVSTTSANVALPSISPVCLVQNVGSVTVYVVFGTSTTVVATSAGTPLQGGSIMTLCGGSNTYIAALAASSTATLLITTGIGDLAIGHS